MADGDLRPSDVAGLSVDGPAHSVALLGADGEVVYPTIHTSDLRSAPQTRWLEQQHGPRVFEITLQRPNVSWTLSHLLWLKQHAPEAWSRLRRVLVVKDYVRARLTGDDLTDEYDAIGTQLYDARARQWSDELCDVLGFPSDRLPRVADAFDIAGKVTAQAACNFGLIEGAPVAVGSGDSVVEAFGVGVVSPGQATAKLATHGNVNAVTDGLCPSPCLITYRHLVGGHGFTIAATNAGASSLRWFRENVAHLIQADAEARSASVHALVEEVAACAPAGSDGLLFHPYLMGERTPHWDPLLRGDFIGIGAHHGLPHFMRAVLEGVAFSLRDCLGTIAEAGLPVRELRVIGGGAKIKLWRQILCDVLGRPLIRPGVEDASFGAAMLASVAVNWYADWREAVAACVHCDVMTEPDEAAHALYSRLYEIYRDAATALRIEIGPARRQLLHRHQPQAALRQQGPQARAQRGAEQCSPR
jgi:xylulokinase